MVNERELLEQVKNGTLSVDDALLKLKTEPFADIGYAKVDLHRRLRQGAAEVIYGAGKTGEQIAGIAETMRAHGQSTVLITRLSPESAELVGARLPLTYHPEAKVGAEAPKLKAEIS